MTNQREYYETERQAEIFLEKEDFERNPNVRGRYGWISRCGLIDADIRFNSIGIYIEYRA